MVYLGNASTHDREVMDLRSVGRGLLELAATTPRRQRLRRKISKKALRAATRNRKWAWSDRLPADEKFSGDEWSVFHESFPVLRRRQVGRIDDLPASSYTLLYHRVKITRTESILCDFELLHTFSERSRGGPVTDDTATSRRLKRAISRQNRTRNDRTVKKTSLYHFSDRDVENDVLTSFVTSFDDVIK